MNRPTAAILAAHPLSLPSAGVLRASAAAGGGLLLALPWRLDPPPLLAVVAVWLAVVGLARAAAGPGPERADAARPHDPFVAPLLAVILAGLVRPVAGAVVAVAWLLRLALARRAARALGGLDAALRDLALPALGAWLAFGGDRGLDAGAVAGAAGGLPIGPWIGANAAALGTIAGWTAVYAAAPRAGGDRMARWLAIATCGLAATLAAAAAAGSVGAALSGVALGLGLWAGPARSVAGAARWRTLAVTGLLLASAGLAAGL